MLNDPLLLKECSGCQKVFPKTSEFFPFKDREKAYFQPRCRKCQSKYMLNYRLANPEKFREKDRAYSKTGKGVYKKLKQSIRGKLVLMSQEEFLAWFESQPKVCSYCGLPEEELQTVKDAYNNKTYRLSIDRLDSTRGYEKGNLALCCLRCNHIKGDFFSASEMARIGSNFVRRKWENQEEH